MTHPSSITEFLRRSRRGQAAVETMMMAFTVAIVLYGMVHLFTVTWASQNAHARAREAILHGTTYLTGDAASHVEGSSDLFDGSNYTRADAQSTVNVSIRADDTTMDDSFGSQEIQSTTRVITVQ